MADTGLHLLYGGTFDPVHLGHLAVARAALAATGAVSLAFVPAADPPHRDAPGASIADRLALLEAALADEPPPSAAHWWVDDREVRRGGRSYTIDTLRDWRRENGPDRPLAFVLGADAFLGLPTWNEWTALLDLAHLVVARRPGSPPLPPADGTLAAATAGRWAVDARELRDRPAGRLWLVDLPLRPESATAIRAALADGRPPEGLSPTVAERIAARGLYAPLWPARPGGGGILAASPDRTAPLSHPQHVIKPQPPNPLPAPADLLKLAVAALEEIKAKDLVEIDVRGKTSVCDFLVIASGTSTRHVKSLADEVVKASKQAGFQPLGVEGEREAEWVLVDLGDVVVHVMLPRVREFYALERLWTVGDQPPEA